MDAYLINITITHHDCNWIYANIHSYHKGYQITRI